MTAALDPSGSTAILLTNLLTDGAIRRVIHGHSLTTRIRETPGRQHFPGQAVTSQHRLQGTHNPKVAGSNPAPATDRPGSEKFWPGLPRHQGFFYRRFYRPRPVEAAGVIRLSKIRAVLRGDIDLLARRMASACCR